MFFCSYALMHLQVSSTKDYVRKFQKKMQNEPNRKDKIQNTEYRRQDKKNADKYLSNKEMQRHLSGELLRLLSEIYQWPPRKRSQYEPNS
jgi:hypothetical protein